MATPLEIGRIAVWMDVDGGEGAKTMGDRVTGPVGTEALEGKLMAVV